MLLLNLFVLKVTFCCGISYITGAGLFSLNVESLLFFLFFFLPFLSMEIRNERHSDLCLYESLSGGGGGSGAL